MNASPMNDAAPSIERLVHAAERLRVVAHPHRLYMLQLLLNQRLTVGELADACQIKSHVASEHLRLMQRCGLLNFARDGRKTFYAVCDPHIVDLMSCVQRHCFPEDEHAPAVATA